MGWGGFRLSLRFSERDPKAAAAIWLRFDSHRPPHAFRRLLDDGQADTRSRKRSLRVDAAKQLKNSLFVFGGKPNAIVFKINSHSVVKRLGPDVNFRTYIRRHKFDGV